MANIKVSVDRLRIGLYIRLPAKWNKHPFLLNSFKIKEQNQIDVIKKLNLLYVYYDPSKSDHAPLSPFEEKGEADSKGLEKTGSILDKLIESKLDHIERLNQYRRKVAKCERNFERSVSRLRAAYRKIKFHPRDSMIELNELVDDIVENILHEGPVALQLINGPVDRDDYHLHVLNVTILSIMIAKTKGESESFIRDVAFAALIHDLGKMKIPTAILNKSTPLTPPEEHYLERHIQYGIEMVKNIDGFPEMAKRAIEQHHEMVDGSGYPMGLSDVDPVASIIAVANSFDNLCHPSVHSEKRVPHAALSYLYRTGKDRYDLENLTMLVKFMGVYPPGTIVELSNKMVGIVISANSSSTLTPEVLIYDEAIPRHQATAIDISKQDLSITGVMNPEKLSEEMREYLNPRSRINYFFSSED